MKRTLALPPILLLCTGCLAPVTNRLDQANANISTTNAQIAETNQRLGDTQAKLALANQQVADLQGKLDETNRRVGVVDQAIQRVLPGLNPKP